MKTRWHHIEDLPEYPAQAMGVLAASQTRKRKSGLPPVGPFLIAYANGAGPLYCDARSWNAAEKSFLTRLIQSPAIYADEHSRLKAYAKKLKALGRKIEGRSFSGWSNAKLKDMFQELENAATILHFSRMLGWVMEQRSEIFSRHLLASLKKHIKQKNLAIQPAAAMATLLAPTKRSLINREQHDLAALSRGKSFPSKARVTRHLRRYYYLTYGLVGPGMTYKECVERIRALRRSHASHPARDDRHTQRMVSRARTALLRQLKLPVNLRQLIDVGKSIGEDKAWSKEVQFYGYAIRDCVNSEIGRRFGFTLREMRWLTPDEVGGLFENKNVPDAVRHRWETSTLLIDSAGMRFLNPREQKEFFQNNTLEQRKNLQGDQKVIHGTPAVLGRASGAVRIVNTADDMKKMSKGDVLVSIMTQPELIPAMRIASAIVTDVGGITCHAAIVSRELGIPCVIGTKIATAALKDGMTVEVDADRGVVSICS